MNDREKMAKIRVLHHETNDYFMKQYLDPENVNHLDWKLEVLEALASGKTPAEIQHYDDVMDLYPDEDTEINLNYSLD